MFVPLFIGACLPLYKSRRARFRDASAPGWGRIFLKNIMEAVDGSGLMNKFIARSRKVARLAPEIFPMHFLLYLQHADQSIAWWFHAHLTRASSGVLLLMSDPGCAGCVGPLAALTGLLLAWKRLWHRLLALGFALPGGMLVNEIMKVTIRRERPFQSSPYLDLGGYSFPSAHTMAATLIYGTLAIFIVSILKDSRLRLMALAAAALLVITVAFSRVALGAHYLTDVLGAMALSVGWLYFSHETARRLIPARATVPAPPGEPAAE